MVTLPVAMLVGNAFGQVDVVLITSGRSSGNLANALLILVTNVGLDLLLIPEYGIAGAAGAAANTVSSVVPYSPRTALGGEGRRPRGRTAGRLCPPGSRHVAIPPCSSPVHDAGPVFPRYRQTSRVSDSGEIRGGLVITRRRMNLRTGQATAHVGMIISRLVVGPPAYQHADGPARACSREVNDT